jgi:multidrug efflux pump subunit AcrA (membrane-fusion protein)
MRNAPHTAIAAAAAILALGAAFAPSAFVDRAAAQANAPTAGAVVIVARASNACFAAMVRVTGVLVPRNEALVHLEAPDGYRVVEVRANEGDQVRSGDVLAILGAKSTDRSGDRGTITIRAPAAGLITKSSAMLGGTPNPLNPRAEPLFRIAADREIELEVEVPSVHVPKLRPGQTARVEVEDGRELTGRVRLTPADINMMTQLGRARVSVDADPSLRVGMFGRATIDADRSCGISVPRGAVLFRTEGPSVQVVRDRKVETRRVKVGLLSDSLAEIREGVRENEMVVAVSGTSLRDGDQVRPILSDGTTAGER